MLKGDKVEDGYITKNVKIPRELDERYKEVMEHAGISNAGLIRAILSYAIKSYEKDKKYNNVVKGFNINEHVAISEKEFRNAQIDKRGRERRQRYAQARKSN